MARNVRTIVVAMAVVAVLATAGSAQVRRIPTGVVSGGDVIASVEFVDTPITTVFKMISDLTGWSIVMSPEVSKQPPRINIWVKNLTADKVLEQVAQLGQLAVDRKESTVRIMTFEEYGRLFGLEKKVLSLRHAAAKDVAAILKPFVEKSDQSRVIPDDRAGKIVLLVPAPLLGSLERLVKAVDVPLPHTDLVEIIPLKHLEATHTVLRLEELLLQGRRSSTTSSLKSAGGAAATAADELVAYTLRFVAMPDLNVIVVRGKTEGLARVRSLIAQLDVPSDIQVISYGLQYTDATEVYETLEQLLGHEMDGGRHATGESTHLRIALSEQNGRIVAEASVMEHKRIAKMIEAIDKALPPGTGGIRVYRLENTTAEQVAAALQELYDELDDETRAAEQGAAPLLHEPVGGVRRVRKPSSVGGTGAPAAAEPGVAGDHSADGYVPGLEVPPRIVAVTEINALIIKASAGEHEEFAELVRELDKPRDQAMLEVTLVVVRSTEGFDLGVEVAGASVNNRSAETIGLTHFGIGSADTGGGTIRLPADPVSGLNYAVFNAGDFSLVLNALRTVGDMRITASPKLLVENNAMASLRSITQEPFEVTDQGETTTTTSFGGYVDAGTILQVVPHLSKGDWLRLAYDVTFSSFFDQENEALPPPRLENNFNGVIRMPSQHVVVIGGLTTTNSQASVASVPFLADVPVLGELFKDRSTDDITETLFIFIRPVILRDPGFGDLIHLSRADIRQAEISRSGEPANPMKVFPDSFPSALETE